ncbi:MAG: hypothetical protein KGJ62_12865 [Armatimonadetes bacterium]|nr:hypothetical protein [Armatimonadota bacterium]MDE2206333.1 hypothetical protein [Armatimonadota bacterium]
MKPHANHRGQVLTEALVASAIMVLIGAALATLVMTTYRSRSLISESDANLANARRTVDELADNIRMAQLYATTSGGSMGGGQNTYSAVAAATANSVTIYTDSSGDTAEFWLDTSNNTLEKTVGATTTALLENVTSLQFTYYTSGGEYNAPASSWTTTANPQAPTSAELPELAAVAISATVAQNGYSRTLNTQVRMRCSPYH